MRSPARIAAALLALVLPLAIAADPPPVIGTWRLNLAKSKYEPESAAPRSDTRTFEMVGDSIKVTARTETTDGRVLMHTETIKADGKPYPVSGSAEFDALTVRNSNPWESRDTLMRAGKVVGHIRSVISRDGKTRTMTVTLTTASGQRLYEVAVFDRQR